MQQRNHKPHAWRSPYARRLPSVHRSVSAHALAHPNPNCIGIPRCLLIRGDVAAELLKRIDKDAYDAILAKATSIGTRKNGLKDGVSNEWFATFDLYAPARRRGQDSSVVIDRPILQDILLAVRQRGQNGPAQQRPSSAPASP